MTDGGQGVAVELAQLRGCMDTGFAKLEGSIALLARNSELNQGSLERLDDRVTALEARRIPLGLLAAVSGAVSAVVAAGAFLVQL